MRRRRDVHWWCSQRPARRADGALVRRRDRRRRRRPRAARSSSACPAGRPGGAPGRATFGAKLISADLLYHDVFSPAASAVWIVVLDAVPPGGGRSTWPRPWPRRADAAAVTVGRCSAVAADAERGRLGRDVTQRTADAGRPAGTTRGASVRSGRRTAPRQRRHGEDREPGLRRSVRRRATFFAAATVVAPVRHPRLRDACPRARRNSVRQRDRLRVRGAEPESCAPRASYDRGVGRGTRPGPPLPTLGRMTATVRLGTCSLADEGLVKHWYPRGVSTPTARLALLRGALRHGRGRLALLPPARPGRDPALGGAHAADVRLPRQGARVR